MAINNVRHPIKDTVKADNSTYSSNKIESLIHSATELPEAGIEDAGDVLMVNDEGEWAKGEIIIPQEVPTPTAPDIGKVISVNASGEYELTTPDSEIFFFDIGLLQASTSSVAGGNDVYLTGMANKSFTTIKQALDAGKRIIARLGVFDQLPTDITFTVRTLNYTITKGDSIYMPFTGYIQAKTGKPMFYKGYFPCYDYAQQGGMDFDMYMFTADSGTPNNPQVDIYLKHNHSI